MVHLWNGLLAVWFSTPDLAAFCWLFFFDRYPYELTNFRTQSNKMSVLRLFTLFHRTTTEQPQARRPFRCFKRHPPPKEPEAFAPGVYVLTRRSKVLRSHDVINPPSVGEIIKEFKARVKRVGDGTNVGWRWCFCRGGGGGGVFFVTKWGVAAFLFLESVPWPKSNMCKHELSMCEHVPSCSFLSYNHKMFFSKVYDDLLLQFVFHASSLPNSSISSEPRLEPFWTSWASTFCPNNGCCHRP